MSLGILDLKRSMAALHSALVGLLLVFGGLSAAVAAESAVFPDDISELRLPADDPRIPVYLVGEDRAYVLGQMRLFLANITRLNSALAAGDLGMLARVAALSGTKRNENDPSRPAGLRERQPLAYNQYIGKVRREFDEIASAATLSSSPAELNGRIAHLMQNCVACHQTFRLTEDKQLASPGN